MADSLDFSQSTISKMLNKKSRPRIDTVCDLLDKLGAKIVFPGENAAAPGCITPEASRVDEVILGMRKLGMDPAAIRDGVLQELSAMFAKNTGQDDEEERRHAI